jgi:DNA-binding beta-propeller fold protein YncE
VSLRQTAFIPLPGGTLTGFDHADSYLDPTGSRIYVAHTATDAVDVIDCRGNAFLRSLPGLPGVAGVLIDTERDLLFTSDRGAGRVSVFRPSDEILLAQVEVGPRPNGLAFDTRRRNLYSFNLGEPADDRGGRSSTNPGIASM